MAVDRNDRVLEMVEETLREDPDVANQELQERAAEIDPRIGQLSARSFNARYPLQVKRKLAAEEGKTAGSDTDGDLRSAVRKELLDFAKAIVGAEDRGEVIDVVEDVEAYVDRVMSSSG